MTWPISTINLAKAWEAANRAADQTNAQVKSLRDHSVSNDTLRSSLVSLQRNLSFAIDTWTTVKSVSGIGDYAMSQVQGNWASVAEVATDFNAMISAATSIRDWIYNNMPKDASTGAILDQAVDADGNLVDLVFTSAQLADFRTEADAFLDTIG
jgi:hypothetical protein